MSTVKTVEPIRTDAGLHLDEVEEIVRERLTSYEQDRLVARPADEVFRRILHPAS